MTELIVGGIKLSAPGQGNARRRLSLLLWGSSGCGKTTFAATAPGKKLLIQFDPDGDTSISDRDDIITMDLSKEPDRAVLKFRDKDPYGIGKFLAANEDVETVIIDSVTSFAEKAMPVAVEEAQGTKKGRNSTFEDPGLAGFGNKNAWVRALIMGMVRLTAAHDRHIIIICHEDKPTTSDEGVIMFISMMLGSSLNEQVPIRISEVWHMSEKKGKRTIAVRPYNLRKPMKTRMFKTGKGSPTTFDLDLDSEDWSGLTLADLYKQWESNEFRKLPVPGTKA